MKLAKIKYKDTEICFLKAGSAKPLVKCFIKGTIINSVTQKKELLYAWKCKIATEVREQIVNCIEKPKKAAISLSFFFCKSCHGNRNDLDSENFVKPVIDAVTKGLFAKEWKNVCKQDKMAFNEDDSVFWNIYFERHDVPDKDQEGVYVTVTENK